MSFSGDTRHTPAATNPPLPAGGPDPRVALTNLSAVQSRMDSLRSFLSDSVNANTPLCQPQIDVVSSEISDAIHQIISNGAALLSCNPPLSSSYPEKPALDPKPEIQLEPELDDYDIVEMDAVELLAEHVHFCEICGKGFKRDANLRMHMRAHGNQFKTRAALAKPESGPVPVSRERTRFSCPFVACNRNKGHKKFRPLKSAICVKNHFKRSHCPKMYSCNRCNKKSFSVVADLKSHLRLCGENKWRCSCGTSFSRKDKLFGHMSLFEGHMPAVVVEKETKEEEEEEMVAINVKGAVENKDDGFFDGLLDEFCMVDDYCFQDVLNSGSVNNGMEEGFFEF